MRGARDYAPLNTTKISNGVLVEFGRTRADFYSLCLSWQAVVRVDVP